jgi:3-isopropylmalate/(R)-2-methylmalate dehydratase small subunit
MGMGLSCVIAEGFGDIFQGNCFQNGMLPVTLPQVAVEELARQAVEPGATVTVDLVSQRVLPPSGAPLPFAIPPLQREALLEGLDEIGQTRRREAEIAAWQARDRLARPWIWRDQA